MEIKKGVGKTDRNKYKNSNVGKEMFFIEILSILYIEIRELLRRIEEQKLKN